MQDTQSDDRKRYKLQMMSNFAAMKFQLKSNKLYQPNQNIKKNQYSRFAKSKPKLPDPSTELNKPKQDFVKTYSIKPDQENNHTEQHMSFRLKYLQKLSNDHLLIGNQYQLDMISISRLNNNQIRGDYRWSIIPSQAITSLSIDQKHSMIAVSCGKTVGILKYNLKRQQECPQPISKSSHEEPVQYVRFARNMSIFIILQTKIQFYRIDVVCQKVQMDKCFVHKINYNSNMKLHHVPQTIDNTLFLYFYENKVKPQEMSKFGLWMQTIQVTTNSNIPIVSKLVLNFNIKVKERKQINIYNYNKDICLIKFPFSIIAVKNGFVIDQANTNFQTQASFIQFIESNHTLAHFRKSFIDIYQLRMNLNCKPQCITLECLDSISFQPPLEGKLFKIIELQPQSYAIFYEQPVGHTKTIPYIHYMFCISQQANLITKIDLFYPKEDQIQTTPIQTFQDTCSQAKKLGMNKKEAYYQLWRRSKKSTKTDFQILLSTEDFPTIEKEIQKKLKAQSMSIRQVIKIYTESLQMLRSHVISSECTVNTLIYYSSCQFSLKKYQMLGQLCSQQKQPNLNSTQDNSDVILINIKDYYQYSDMQVLNEFVQLIGVYLQKKSQKILRKIKAILQYFNLIFRLCYLKTIDKIIDICKLRIKELLQVIPELFPYQFEDQQQGIGLWTPVKEQEKQQNVFLSDLKTIDNKCQIQDFTKHIWFKRNINTNHGVILINRQQINSHIEKKNNYEDIFYKILFRLYNFKMYQNLKDLIIYIQNNYKLYPVHLRGKFKLYVILYQMFQNFNKNYGLQQFLRFKQFQLFKMYFQIQKLQKGGFILNKIRPLYQRIFKNQKQIFNKGMYEYFSSEQSTVADLKSILNKLNNQKNEFHIEAQKLYEVLINAVMKKIKIGSPNDTPIDEILVYIQNIPFPIHNESIMTNLQYIQQINYESEILKNIKINMTLQEVVNNPKKVIEMMIQYQINRLEIHKLKDYRELKMHAYKILSQVQCRKSNIFGDKQHNYSLKIFLIKVMANKQIINLCKQLLMDQYLITQFMIYTEFVEEIAMILYHWKLRTRESDKDTPFLSHLQYLQALAQLLNDKSPKKQYIQYSIRYAQLLSFEKGFQIQYPLFSNETQYPVLNDFVQTINCLSAKQIAQINLKQLFQVIIGLKTLKEDELVQSEQLKIYKQKMKVQLYQQLIMRLIQQNQLHSALQNIFILIQLPNDYPQYNIIYCCLIIEKLLSELLQNSINLIIKLISYYFHAPKELAEMIKHLFSKPFSNKEIDIFIQTKIKQQQHQPILTMSNPIIHTKIKQNAMHNPREISKLLELCLYRIIKHNELYKKSYHLHIMFRLMCHSPLIISKWIICKKTGINAKTIRSFISYMSLQLPFDPEKVLSCGRDIFQIISFQYTHTIFFTEILKWLEQLSFHQMHQAASNLIISQDHTLDLINESISVFTNKLNELKMEHSFSQQKQQTNYNQLITHPEGYMEKPLSHYIYNDRDDGYENMADQLHIPIKKRKKVKAMSSSKQSQISEKQIFTLDQLFVPKQTHRARRFSQYFPEMLDVQQVSINNLAAEPQEFTIRPKTKTKGEKATSNQIKNKIIEDQCQHITSSIRINLSDSQVHSPVLNTNGFSIIPMTLPNRTSINRYFGSQKNSQHLSIQSEQMSKDQSMYMDEEQEQSLIEFKINVIEYKRPPMPATQLMQKLLQTVPGKEGIFDLTLLTIEARQQNFRQYLEELLQHIYSNSFVSFYKRLNLILTIAQQYQSQYFSKQCISIFQRLSKSKIIPNLPFKIAQTTPIQLIFQPDAQSAFKIFLSKILPKIDPINIFLAREYTHQLFQNIQLKDTLLMEFIIHRIKFCNRCEADQEHNKEFIVSLIEDFHNKRQILKTRCLELSQGSEQDKKVAETLQKYISQSAKYQK